jgi:hypothetical protein
MEQPKPAKRKGRPQKPAGTRARKFSVTLSPDVDDELGEIMLQDRSDNRSATIAKLVTEETERRVQRARRRSAPASAPRG